MRKLHCSDEMMAFKKWIPIEERGKSGGLRTIIASCFNGR